MERYCLLPESFRRIKRLFLTIYFIGFLALIAPIFYGINGELYRQSPSNFILLAVFSVVFLLVFLGGLGYLQVRSQQQNWLSYQLFIGPDSVLKKQRRMPDLEIKRDQITSLHEFPSKGLLIKTGERRRFIFVPVSVERYDEVKARLTQWREIEPVPQRTAWFRQVVYYSLMLVGTVALITAMKSQEPRIFLPLGLLLVPFLLWGLIETQRSPNVDRRFKLWSWLMLLPVFLLVMKMISALS